MAVQDEYLNQQTPAGVATADTRRGTQVVRTLAGSNLSRHSGSAFHRFQWAPTPHLKTPHGSRRQPLRVARAIDGVPCADGGLPS